MVFRLNVKIILEGVCKVSASVDGLRCYTNTVQGVNTWLVLGGKLHLITTWLNLWPLLSSVMITLYTPKQAFVVQQQQI